MNVNGLKAHEIIISTALRHSVKSSRQQYMFFVQNKKELEKSRKQKLIEDKVTELKRKKSLLATSISELHSDTDRFAYEVGNSNNFESMKSLLTK